jgi:hypothetical protein
MKDKRDLLSSATKLVQQEDRIEKEYQERSRNDFMLFVQGLNIDSQKGKRLFFPIMADFQKSCFEAMAIPLRQLRDGDMPDTQRFWIERTKKGSKDADLAIVIAWLMFYCERPFFGQIGAADRDQAAIVKDRLSALLQYNPWLTDNIEIVGNEIRTKQKRVDGSPLGRIDIRSSEVAGAHGGTPDIMILNELSHIGKWEFAENMMDNADGVAQGIVMCATNAGFRGSDAWAWRENAMTSPAWSTHILSKPAPWHSKATIYDAEKRNPRGRFLRLWRGIWVSGKGDAITEEDLEAIFCLDGPEAHPRQGWTYVAGLDIGVKKDHSGFVILGSNMVTEKVRVAVWKRWDPKQFKGNEIDLSAVENVVRETCELFKVRKLMFDPSQALFMAQRLRKVHLRCDEMQFVPSNLVKMAECFIQVTKNKNLIAYDDEKLTLQSDIGKLQIAEKSYGFRLEATRDSSGHADIATALLCCLPEAVKMMFGHYSDIEDAVATDLDQTDLSEEELEEMPDDLKDLYEMDVKDHANDFSLNIEDLF